MTKGVVVCSQPQLSCPRLYRCGMRRNFLLEVHAHETATVLAPGRGGVSLHVVSLLTIRSRKVCQDPSLSQRPSVCKDRRVVPAVNSVSKIAAGSTRPDRVRTPEPPGILVMSGKTSVTATPSGGHPPGHWRKRTVRSARLRCTERPGSMRRCRRRRQT